MLAIYLPLLLLDIFPHRPRGLAGWIVLAAFGVPIAIALEALSGFVLAQKRGHALSSARFSAARILFAMGYLLIVGGVLYGLAYLAWPHIREYFF